MKDSQDETADDSYTESKEFDYIIVGSGAGGAPLASRLARAGKRVLVIEAGSNSTEKEPQDPGNEVSQVPLLHAASSEHPDLAWRFFVEHYQRGENGKLPDGISEDPKRHTPQRNDVVGKQQKGIFYPRAAGIGGCTIHNAMITIAGPDSDWDDLASFLGDASWSGKHMRAYFQRLEHNDYLPVPDRIRRRPFSATWQYIKNSLRFLRGRRPDTTSGRHGFDGWLHTSLSDFKIGLQDKQLVKMLAAALWQSKLAGLDYPWATLKRFFRGEFIETLDPNHSETQANSPEGIVMVPLAIHGRRTNLDQNAASPYAMLGRRSSPREYLLETIASHPGNLTLWTDTLVTQVILRSTKGQDEPQAVGVKYQEGKRLYRAHVDPSKERATTKEVRVADGGEVILCGGAFNTPQLLMLSGIGDAGQLGEQKIPCKVELSGVGRNLQDRYEVSVVSEMKKDFSLLAGATLNVPADGEGTDAHLRPMA